MDERRAERVAHLREALVRRPAGLTPEVAERAEAALDRDDDTAAGEILAADLDARRPTVTWAEMGLLVDALNLFSSHDVDSARYPHLDRRHYILGDLPVISRGDRGAPPRTGAEQGRALGELLDALAARLGADYVDSHRSLHDNGEDVIALDLLLAKLEGRREALTRREREMLRRQVQFYDLDDGDPGFETAVPRGDEILAALPVIDP